MTNAGGSSVTLGVVAVIWVLALAASGISPYDRLTWFMEVAPVLIALPILYATRASFPLTRLAYVLICIHGLILIYGGTYSYARVPAGFWIQEWWGFERNQYDRLGHLAQGFVPAIMVQSALLKVDSAISPTWPRLPAVYSSDVDSFETTKTLYNNNVQTVPANLPAKQNNFIDNAFFPLISCRQTCRLK